MQKKFHNVLLGISVLPALLVLPAWAVPERVEDIDVAEEETYTNTDDIITGYVGVNGSFINDGTLAVVDEDGDVSVLQNFGTVLNNGTITEASIDNMGVFTNSENASIIASSELYNSGDFVNDGSVLLTEGGVSNTTGYRDGLDGFSVLTTFENNGTFEMASTEEENSFLNYDSLVVNNGTMNINGILVNFEGHNANLNEEADVKPGFINHGTLNVVGNIKNDTSTFVSDGVFNMTGRIENKADSTLTLSGESTFSGNEFTGKGGAIYNAGTLTINGGLFEHNSATSNSGAIAQHDTNSVLKLTDVNFTKNSADWGGAIVARGTVDIIGGSFTGNTSNDGGGAIYLATLANKGHKLNIDGTTFSENSTEGVGSDGGGAIGSFSDLVLKNATFTGNHVDGATSNGGGAIFMGSVSTNDIYNTTFTGNQSATNGGAISMRFVQGDNTNAGNNIDGTIDILDSTFTSNVATDKGGAIYNTFHNDKNDDGYAYFGNSTFDKNIADQGGAIYNETFGNVDPVGGVLWLENVAFTGNTATTEGGAIYNNGDMTFAGTNSFSGNTAADVANDIYNAGTLTLADGSTTTIDGGITGDGTLNIASGATFNLGTASVTQGTMVLNGTLNATLKDADNFAFFVVGDEFNGDGTLNFDLRAAGEYNVFQGALFDKDKVSVSGGIFDWDWNEDFDTIVATMKSTEEIAAENGISNEAATTVANLVNSSSGQLNDFAVAIQDKLSSGDADTAAAVEHAHAAIHPETESVVQTVAMHVQNTVANLAAGRLTALGLGRNGGDVNVTGGGIWAQGIYNKSKQNGAFRGYTRGVTGGVDMTLDRVLTLGAGYSYAHSDMAGTARDTDVDSSTIFAYGQYKPTDWFVHAMANYTMSDYSEHSVALGTNIDANYDVRAYGGQVMTGYDFAGGITPAIGVRYMHISADEYKNSLGIKNKLQDSDYMTAMLETKWTYGFQLSRGLMLRPELRYAVKYDFVSDEQTATILLPGVDSYVMDGNRLSRLGAEFGGGLGMKFSGLDLSVNYDIEIREGFTSQTGRVRVRYEF